MCRRCDIANAMDSKSSTGLDQCIAGVRKDTLISNFLSTPRCIKGKGGLLQKPGKIVSKYLPANLTFNLDVGFNMTYL